LTESSRLLQAFSLMVKAVSDDTLKTASPAVAGKGESTAMRALAGAALTWRLSMNISLTVNALPAMSLLG